MARPVYVTREQCDDKKTHYVPKDVCLEKERAMRGDINEIRERLDKIDNKLDNHLQHVQADISKIYASMAGLTALVKSVNSQEKNDTLDKRMWILIGTIVLLLLERLYHVLA